MKICSMTKALLIKFWLRFFELTLKFRSLGAPWATQERLVNENITVYTE